MFGTHMFLAVPISVMVTLLAFPIGATAASTTSPGSVTVRWTFASQNIDGSPLVDLAGARVYYGSSSSNYTHVIDLSGGTRGQTYSHTVTGLVAGATYYLNGTAYSTTGLESDFCAEVAKVAVTTDDTAALQVSAGPGTEIILGDAFVLQGALILRTGTVTQSDVTITWSQQSGPAPVIFSDVHALTPTVTFNTAGTYVLQIAASDGITSSSDQVTVVVRPPPIPVAPSSLRLVD